MWPLGKRAPSSAGWSTTPCCGARRARIFTSCASRSVPETPPTAASASAALTRTTANSILNGKPIYLRGALDQDFFPDTIYTPPSLDYLRDEMRKAKALGLNLLRCHIKVPDPRYLEAADEIGMLVWYEIPNWDKLTADSERRAMETLHGMVERDANHPSIVIVSIINESWGANLKEAAGPRLAEGRLSASQDICPLAGGG